MGPLYFLVNASMADDWIGYALLAVVGVFFLMFVVWPRKWTALLVCLVALCWVIPGCIDESSRKLPWRETRDPYAIAVSEFMLQQTQVTTVLPYYARWLTQFPSNCRLTSWCLQQ